MPGKGLLFYSGAALSGTEYKNNVKIIRAGSVTVLYTHLDTKKQEGLEILGYE